VFRTTRHLPLGAPMFIAGKWRSFFRTIGLSFRRNLMVWIGES
jgi:hypothetical protein